MVLIVVKVYICIVFIISTIKNLHQKSNCDFIVKNSNESESLYLYSITLMVAWIWPATCIPCGSHKWLIFINLCVCVCSQCVCARRENVAI